MKKGSYYYFEKWYYDKYEYYLCVPEKCAGPQRIKLHYSIHSHIQYYIL